MLSFFKTAGNWLCTGGFVWYSAATEQSEEFNRRGDSCHFWGASEDPKRTQKCSADGAGGQLWTQTEG